MFELKPFERKTNQLTVFDPFKEMEELERTFFGNSFFAPRAKAFADLRTDIQDKGDSFLLEADLPGFKKEDIALELDGDCLSISAERHSEHEEKDKQGNYLRCERSYGSFRRSFDVSGINTDEIRAEYKDGVLSLTLPKKETAAPASRRLEIN